MGVKGFKGKDTKGIDWRKNILFTATLKIQLKNCKNNNF